MMSRTKFPLLLLVAATPGAADLAAQRVTVSHRGVVTADAPTRDHAEAWLSVSPIDPREALVGVLAGSGDISALYLTSDGGATWRSQRPPRGDGLFDGGDPIVVHGPDGTAYFSTITPAFQVWRRPPGGTLTGPVVIPARSWDRQFLAVSTGANGTTVWGAGKTPIQIHGHIAEDVLAIASSRDGGASFLAPRLVLPDPTKQIIQAPAALLASDSSLMLFYHAHDVPVRDVGRLRNTISVTISRDGGRRFEPPASVSPAIMFGNRGSTENMLKGLASGGAAFDGSPRSPHRGTIYFVWLDAANDRLRVKLSVSRDGGRQWAPAREVAPSDELPGQSNPGIAVAADGAILVIWNDRKRDPTDRCFRGHVAASLDGGQTFSPPVALSERDLCPLPVGATADPGRFGGRYLNGGETQGIAALGPGRFLVTWLDDIGGRMQLRASEIAVGR